MRKKLTALMVMLTLLCTLLPQLALAADRVSIDVYGFKLETQEVWVFAKNIEAGDVYGVYLNENYTRPVQVGTFASNGENVVKLLAKEHPILNNLQSGDRLTVRVTSAGLNNVLGETTVKLDNVGAKPSRMDLVTTSLVEGKSNQEVRVRFNRDYEPTNQDDLRLVPINKEGNRLEKKESLTFSISSGKLYTKSDSREMTINLTPHKDAVAYEVQFISGDLIADNLTKKIPVGPDFGSASELVVNYPSNTVKIGERISPDVYLKNSRGDKLDVANTAIFTYTGDALELNGRDKGDFRVRDDEKYIGSKIIVTAVSGRFSKTTTLSVVGKTPETPKVEKIDVIMGINSSDILVNGAKKKSDAPAIIRDNRTFVPLRAMAEAFGAKVDFNNENQSITVTLDNKIVLMTIGNKSVVVNGTPKAMDVAPFIVKESGRTMVPVRFAAEALGFSVKASKNNDGTTANVVFSNY